MKDLGKDAENVRPVFISLDPGDTAESLKAFLKPYDARIIALHGTQKDIDKLIETYQLYTATAINQQTGQAKVMDHAPNLFLFDKNAQYRGDFAPNESAKDISEDIRLAMQKE
jgi:cytochrome oxidase Cu insertion factor (SCO1/SenC/PrrC family)